VKNKIITILKFAASIGILAYLFFKARQQNEFDSILESQKNWGWIAFAILAGFSACMTGFVRWFILIRALDIPLKLVDAIRLGFLGHFFNLMSFGVFGGDALKGIFVARQVPKRKTEAVISILADRALGLLAMFTVAAVAYWVMDFETIEATGSPESKSIAFLCQFATVATIMGFAGCGLMLVMGGQTEKSWAQQLTRIPFVGVLFWKLLSVISIYRTKPKAIIVSILMSLWINVCFASSIFGVAAGLSDEHPSIGDHFVIAPIAMLANAAPLPGGIGGMEFALNFLYQAFSKADATADMGFVVALAFRLVLLSVAMVGVFVYLMRRKEIDSLQEEGASEKNVASQTPNETTT